MSSRYLWLYLSASFLSGCATSIKDLPVNWGDHHPEGVNDRTQLHVQYLGTGGFLFRYGTDAILTAPFFSNHSLLRTTIFPIWPKTAVIDRLLPSLAGVDAILVGHCHYDHLLDLPYILNSTRISSPVYGSKTMLNLLTRHVTNKLVEVESTAGAFTVGGSQGEWVRLPGSTIRFMALKSMHAHQLGPLKLYGGEITTPKKYLPLTAWGWKEGQTLAYIIDFMKEDGVTIAYRVVYHDSAVDCPPYGSLPKFRDKLDVRRPDLAIVALASSDKVYGYPSRYLERLDPKSILIGHWDDFFRSQKRPLKAVRMTNAKKFYSNLPERYQKQNSILAAPGACFRFDVD
jgi:L-ascorbate metabolism protein UlaG (beta-lactamase superfamily)